jgi:hypothetical protein
MNCDVPTKPAWRDVWLKILEGTCVALIFWVLGDIFDKHNCPKIGDFFEFLTVSALLITAALFALSYCQWPWLIWPICISFIIGLFAFLIHSEFSEAQLKSPLPPIISPTIIQLNDGQWSEEKPVDIFNPNDFPIYQIMLQFLIEGDGVSANSVSIRLDPEVKYDCSIRMDYVHEPHRQIVFYCMPGLQSKHHVQLFVSGTTPVKSYAVVSVHDFTNSSPGFRYLNGANSEIIPPHGAVMMPGFVIPVGGTLTNFSLLMTSNVFKMRVTIK